MKLPIGALVARKDLVAKMLDKDFAGRTSLKFKILAKEVSKYVDMYEEERVKLVKKYGDEKDGQVSVNQEGENWTKFISELGEAANEEVEVNVPSFTEEELVADDSVKITARELLDMEIFYEKKEEKTE